MLRSWVTDAAIRDWEPSSTAPSGHPRLFNLPIGGTPKGNDGLTAVSPGRVSQDVNQLRHQRLLCELLCAPTGMILWSSYPSGMSIAETK